MFDSAGSWVDLVTVSPTMFAWLGWTAADVPLLLALPVLILLSAFFSGSETCFFSMTGHERLMYRRSGTLVGRAVVALTANPRMLLITLLLGNMTVNVFYFVVSSVLMMRADGGWVGELIIGLVSLVVILIFGEVLPKMLANTRRDRFAQLVAPILVTIHRTILPLRVGVDRLIVTPLGRLTAPASEPPELSRAELEALLNLSGEQGHIDDDEQRILAEVLDFRRLKVRDVMTPRVHMHGVETSSTRDQVVAMVRETRLTRLPVCDGDLDRIVGILHVKRFLLDGSRTEVTDSDVLSEPAFVPAVATLDKLLDHFRRTKQKSAIVVDEFGGTAGIVSIADVVEELVGEITGSAGVSSEPPERLSDDRWRVAGLTSVHDWADAFGQDQVPPRIATLGGLITERLGRSPVVGDTVDLGNVHLEVETVEGLQVVTAIVTLGDEASDAATSDGEGGHA